MKKRFIVNRRNIELVRYDKKGQFYLVAAVVIVGLLIGFVGVANYSRKKPDVRIYDLKDELKYEGDYVIDYGIMNNEWTVENILKDFTELYSDYAKENLRHFYFIFGNKDKLLFVTYEEIVVGSIFVEGTRLPTTAVTGVEKIIPISEGDETITVKINDVEHNFDLKQGENFYYIISQSIEGEEYVIKN